MIRKYLKLFLTVGAIGVLLHAGLLSTCPKKMTFTFPESNTIVLPDTVYSNWELDYSNNNMYIADWDWLKLSVINESNDVIRSITFEEGQGPGELFWPTKFSVSENAIYILHSFGMKVTIFDTLGVFIKDFTIKLNAQSIDVFNNQIYLTAMNIRDYAKNILYIYNQDGEFIKNSIPGFRADPANRKELEKVGLSRMLPSSYFFEGDTVWVMNPFQNTILAYYNNTIIQSINGPANVVTPPEIVVSESSQGATIRPLIRTLTTLAVDDTYLYVNAWNSKEHLHFLNVYSKKGGECLYSKETRLKKKTPLQFVKFYDNHFYFYSKAGSKEITKHTVHIEQK